MLIPETRQTNNQPNRIYWLDNLRTFMIFLVVLIHAAIIYEKNSMGAAWWIVCDPSTNDLPGILFLILNIFVMAAVFFVSGYFAHLSLQKKTGWSFIKTKFKRLMLPWLIGVLTLIPLYKVIFLHARHLPQEHWTSYFHWNTLWSQNWLWFLPVLFAFEILYLGLNQLKRNVSRITIRQSLLAAFIICLLYSIAMDYFNLQGWTKSILIDFQNERLLIYLALFLLGAQCCRHQVFDSSWKNKKLDIILHSIGWIPMNLYLFQLIYAIMNPGKFLVSDLIDTILIRLNFVLAMAYLLYAMIATFYSFFNRQTPLGRELNNGSYSVYLIHVIVMGPIAIALQNTTLPSLAKLPILTLSTFIISNLIAYGFRKVRHSIHHQSQMSQTRLPVSSICSIE